MIQSKTDYLRYLEADRIALGRKHKYGFRDYFYDPVWSFERSLRRFEYWINCKRGLVAKFMRIFCRLRHEYWGRVCGFSIGPNIFGPGLSIAHKGTIVINPNVRIGGGCRIHVCVNIGEGRGGNPRLGENVYIAPGAKIFGGIVIGDNTKIGANAVVNKTFPEGHCTLVGIPAKKIEPAK